VHVLFCFFLVVNTGAINCLGRLVSDMSRVEPKTLQLTNELILSMLCQLALSSNSVKSSSMEGIG